MWKPEAEVGVIQQQMSIHYSFSVEKGNAGGNVHELNWFLQREDTKIWLEISLVDSDGPAAAATTKTNKRATNQLPARQFRTVFWSTYWISQQLSRQLWAWLLLGLKHLSVIQEPVVQWRTKKKPSHSPSTKMTFFTF